MTNPYLIRAMHLSDIPRLVEIRPGFTSETVLRVETFGADYQVGWRLIETQLDKPYHKGHGYDFDATERENIRQRLLQPNTLEEVVEDQQTGRIVGVLDVAQESWRQTAWIWNIMLDEAVRGQGLGRELIEHSIGWARQRRLRAVMLETQTNNVPACKFYARMGFQLVGINVAFYGNRDLEKDEVAIFWSLPL